MESVSKRLRKKGIQRFTPFTSGQGKKTNGFFLTPPPFSLFPTEITRQFPRMLTPGPGLSNPDLLA